MNRLDWGCAFDKHEGWVGSDLIDYGQQHVGNILEGLPFPDQHFDMVVCNHSLQMITFTDMPRALAELRRVLKVGGVLRILVPDMDRVLALWSEPVPLAEDALPISSTLEPTKDGRVLRYMFWHGDARSAFTSTSLADTLARSGFDNVQFCDFKQTHSQFPEIVELDSRGSESIICEVTR